MANVFESRHFKAISQLYPLQMDAEEYAVSRELDRVLEYSDEAYDEIFPSTAVSTLEKWENLYELGHSGTLDYRRKNLLSAYNRDSGIAQRHYEAIAKSMSYDVTVRSPSKLFRAGVSRLGAAIFDLDEQYTWTVVSAPTISNVQPLINAFESDRIPFTDIRWEVKSLCVLKLEDGNPMELENGRIFILE